nr:hypothetical protein Q903MT_gene157 [Picea sitchensis]
MRTSHLLTFRCQLSGEPSLRPTYLWSGEPFFLSRWSSLLAHPLLASSPYSRACFRILFPLVELACASSPFRFLYLYT